MKLQEMQKVCRDEEDGEGESIFKRRQLSNNSSNNSEFSTQSRQSQFYQSSSSSSRDASLMPQRPPLFLHNYQYNQQLSPSQSSQQQFSISMNKRRQLVDIQLLQQEQNQFQNNISQIQQNMIECQSSTYSPLYQECQTSSMQQPFQNHHLLQISKIKQKQQQQFKQQQHSSLKQNSIKTDQQSSPPHSHLSSLKGQVEQFQKQVSHLERESAILYESWQKKQQELQQLQQQQLLPPPTPFKKQQKSHYNNQQYYHKDDDHSKQHKVIYKNSNNNRLLDAKLNYYQNSEDNENNEEQRQRFENGYEMEMRERKMIFNCASNWPLPETLIKINYQQNLIKQVHKEEKRKNYYIIGDDANELCYDIQQRYEHLLINQFNCNQYIIISKDKPIKVNKIISILNEYYYRQQQQQLQQSLYIKQSYSNLYIKQNRQPINKSLSPYHSFQITNYANPNIHQQRQFPQNNFSYENLNNYQSQGDYQSLQMRMEEPYEQFLENKQSSWQQQQTLLQLQLQQQGQKQQIYQYEQKQQQLSLQQPQKFQQGQKQQIPQYEHDQLLQNKKQQHYFSSINQNNYERDYDNNMNQNINQINDNYQSHYEIQGRKYVQKQQNTLLPQQSLKQDNERIYLDCYEQIEQKNVSLQKEFITNKESQQKNSFSSPSPSHHLTQQQQQENSTNNIKDFKENERMNSDCVTLSSNNFKNSVLQKLDEHYNQHKEIQQEQQQMLKLMQNLQQKQIEQQQLQNKHSLELEKKTVAMLSEQEQKITLLVEQQDQKMASLLSSQKEELQQQNFLEFERIKNIYQCELEKVQASIFQINQQQRIRDEFRTFLINYTKNQNIQDIKQLNLEGLFPQIIQKFRDNNKHIQFQDESNDKDDKKRSDIVDSVSSTLDCANNHEYLYGIFCEVFHACQGLIKKQTRQNQKDSDTERFKGVGYSGKSSSNSKNNIILNPSQQIEEGEGTLSISFNNHSKTSQNNNNNCQTESSRSRSMSAKKSIK